MTQKKGKFFYYEVTSTKNDIKVFLTSKNNVGYFIGIRFVEELNFTASPDSLYLPYRNVSENVLYENKNAF
jgi:hypothetical protein